MTQEQIEELKRLAEAATPGPWVSHPKGYYGAVCRADDQYDLVAVTHGQRRNNVLANEAYIAAANPAAVLELIAEVEQLREDADDLTIALESSEKALKDSRANDYTAMGYLADCRVAVGDNGKRMLPEFVEYLRKLKQQRDELLAALELFMERVDEPPEANCSCHISPPCNDCVENWGLREAFSDAKEAIAKAEG